MTAVQWAELLGRWPDRKGPLHRRLSMAIRQAIEHGVLGQGTRLPSERDLAAALSISRNTVVAAYNAVRDEGWLESRTGGGTWVRREVNAIRVAQEEVRFEWLAQSNLLGVLDQGESFIDFATGTPYPLRGLPEETMVLTREENEWLLGTRLYHPFGLPTLRRAIASFYSAAGLPTVCEEILVTTGAQQAIMLTAHLFLQRGDTVLLEDPCYFGALEVFRGLGARLHAVPAGVNGVEPRAFRDALAGANPRLAYLTPTFQNPTGTVMPASARKEIVQAAAARLMPVVDDQTVAGFAFDAAAPGPLPLATWDTNGTVITIGSLDKLMWAGLRIGWIRAARHLIERMVRLKMANDLGTALPNQALAVKMMAHQRQAVTLRAKELRTKCELMAAMIRAELPDWEFHVPSGGLFLWIRLPGGDSRELAQVAMRHRLALMPGPNMSADERHSDMLRVPFLLEEDDLREGIRRLAMAWREYREGNGGHRVLQTVT